MPRSGRVISCALPFDQNGPQTGLAGRHNPIHLMLADGGDALAGAQDFLPGGFNYADDAVPMPLQCGTQWDALSHVFYDGKMYNDRDVKLVTSQGARVNAIERIADGVVGRGVLLDLPRFLRRTLARRRHPHPARGSRRLRRGLRRGDRLGRHRARAHRA